MIDSEEEYVMDFEADNKRLHLTHFDEGDIASNSSTLSASEVASGDDYDPTPPLFYKLKKARVLIKKLPGHILAKHNLSSKKASINSQPSRSSGRIKGKHIPVGRYMALHRNKPLEKIISKQKKFIEKLKKKHSLVSICNSNNSVKKTLGSVNLSRSLPSISTNISTNESASSVLEITKLNPANNCSSLHETARTKRTMKKPTETPLPYLPDVIITRYDMPPTSTNHFVLNESDVAKTVRISLAHNLKNNETISKPNTPSYTKLSLPRNAQSKVFPAFIAPAPSAKQSCSNVMPSNVAAIDSNNDLHRVSKSTPRKFTIQAFKVPNNLSETNYLIPVDSPQLFVVDQTSLAINHLDTSSSGGKKFTVDSQKLFVVDQSSLAINPLDTPISGGKKVPVNFPKPLVVGQSSLAINHLDTPSSGSKKVAVDSPKLSVVDQSSLAIDPSDTPSSGGKNKKSRQRQNDKENSVVNKMGSHSYLELKDVEKQIEPEVIKRIFYHTKSVQTKFTCNSSICGLVDSDEFNLNCFYCYDIFPLQRWFEFKEHIKVVHQVEENANESDSEIDTDNSYLQNRSENVSKPMNSAPRYMCEKDRGKLISKASNTTEQVYKKLPLEPKLLAQRQNKIIAEPAKLVSSTPKIVNQSQNSEKLPESNFPCVNFKTSPIDQIINLDSDNCDLDIEDLDDASKTAKRDLQPNDKIANKEPNTNNNVRQGNDSKLVLPTLPHITIKKIEDASPKQKIDTVKPTSKQMPYKEKFIKIPSTTNIQKVIKTLPRPTAKQLSENGKTRPRYFVVKKIIKLPTSDQVSKASDLNIPKGTILTKMQLESKNNYTTSASIGPTDKIEDSVPKPTSGLGILFGLTNSMVVIEFLLKLKTFPELWRAELKNNDSDKYNESLKKLCFHINNRFDLNMTEFEMRLSIQRVKDWYYLMLQSIREHKEGPNKTEPYKHRFPIYFKILSQYLTPDADEKGLLLNEIISKTTLSAKADFLSTHGNVQQPTLASTTTPIIAPTSEDISQNPEVTADNLIEFDADTLYDQESSDEEVLEAFDEFVFFKNKTKNNSNADGKQKRRTKVYLGSFECDICHKVFKRTCDLKRHKVRHLPPQFECGHCLQKFHFKHWADRCRHRKTYKYQRVDKASGEKRVWPKKIFEFNMICEICGNSYRSIGSLNTHKRDKHFNQRHKCIVCNFTALSNWRIVQHQRKRHIVEPGLPEEVAKKSRARTESKTSFSNEARQAFDWRREMRKNVKPGEKFYGCCRCKIVFETRKEKVYHNKIEHPITEFTVICLLCLPNKLILSNANCARRHYTDIHKVPWHEIDALVKCTKPIFDFLNKEEIDLLKASENYKELLDELLKDKKFQIAENVQTQEDEVSKAVQNLPNKKDPDEADSRIEVECIQEENVYVDGIIEHENNYNKHSVCTSIYEHNYSENFDAFDVVVENREEDDFYPQQSCEAENVTIAFNSEGGDKRIQNEQEYVPNIVEDFVEGELVEESIVVEEYIDEVIVENDGEFVQI